MTRRLRYEVYSCDQTKVRVEATLDSGKVIEAFDTVLMIQLVPLDNKESGTVKLVISDETPEDYELFKPGEEVTLTVS